MYVTLAGIMLGGIVILSQVFLRGMFYSSMMGSRRRYSSGGQGGGQAQIVIMVIALAAAILAPIMAYLLYFALSRRREYLADAGAARLTRYPEGLASALEKIANDPAPQLAAATSATAPMYIANPFKKKGQRKLSDLTSTHPPISERVRILRNMSQGASFGDYAAAYGKVAKGTNVVPASAMKKEDIQIREGRAEPPKEQKAQKQVRQVGDIMRMVNGFVFLTCLCGLKLKVPPNFKAPTVKCPRCSRTLDVAAQKRSQASQSAGA
jgi:heat shock protein HtpX